MGKIFPKKGTYRWGEILSLTIFKLDLIEGFKYRKTQTWLCCLGILMTVYLVAWPLFIGPLIQWSIAQIALFFSPLLVAAFFWIRACAIFDLRAWETSREKWPITKKQARASVMSRGSLIVFGCYYCYFVVVSCVKTFM